MAWNPIVLDVGCFLSLPYLLTLRQRTIFEIKKHSIISTRRLLDAETEASPVHLGSSFLLVLSFVVELSIPSGHILYVSIKEREELKPGGLDDCFVFGVPGTCSGVAPHAVCVHRRRTRIAESFVRLDGAGRYLDGRRGRRWRGLVVMCKFGGNITHTCSDSPKLPSCIGLPLLACFHGQSKGSM